jgi:glycosyltransferase involved in cell wall biosynthesis
MRVALVYDRLNKIGGAEQVLIEFNRLFPNADWYTSVYNPNIATFAKSWHVKSSWLSGIPILRDHHEFYPFLMPFIFESFDFSSYDLVISIGSAECKGIITLPHTIHLHYCLTPTRYLYSHSKYYLSNPIYRMIAAPLRAWDQVAAYRPDIMIAISTQVKKRIKKYYNRPSEVIFPPVDTSKFEKQTPLTLPSKISHLSSPYFLVVSRLVPYKRLETLIETFRLRPKYKLVIVGVGSEMLRLKKMSPSNVTYVGFVSDVDLPSYYAGAKAYLQANEEDFGISMVEAQASGIPVIAYSEGGASDIVVPGKTGILTAGNTPADFAQAIDKLDRLSFDSEACRQNALRFDKTIWQKQISERINKLCKQLIA